MNGRWTQENFSLHDEKTQKYMGCLLSLPYRLQAAGRIIQLKTFFTALDGRL